MPIIAFFGGGMPNLLGRRFRCDLWNALQEKQSYWQACLEQRLANIQASAQCPRDSVKLYQVDPLTLMLLGMVVMMVPIVIFFGLVFAALFIYVWTHSYPWLKMVGKFAARPANFFSLLILAVLLFVAFIGVAILLMNQLAEPLNLLTVFLFLLVLVLIPILFVVFILVGLGIVVWIARLIKWLFAHWRGWLEGVYFSARLELIRLKIKADTLQETGFRGKPASGVRGRPGSSLTGKPGIAVRGKPTTGFKTGKKGMSFKEKLEALKSEFSGDVQRARSKLSRRK